MNRPRIELPPQSSHRFVQHLASLVNHHDVLAHLLGMRHDVRREQHRGAAAVLPQDVLPENAHAHGVLAAERLVEDEQVRLMDDALRGTARAAACPSTGLRSACLRTPGNPISCEESRHACCRRLRGQPLQLRHVAQKGADLHLAVDAALFRQVPDAVLRLERRPPAQDRQLAGIREQDRHDHADAASSCRPRSVR